MDMKDRNLQDIIPDREIVKLQNQEFAGIEYEQWRIGVPIWGEDEEEIEPPKKEK